jgi:hypothetical protein
VAKLYDTPRGMRIYHWLRRTPELVKVIGTDAGDQTISVSLARQPNSGQPKWKDAIGALIDCVKLQGLDAAGDVVRVLSLDPDADPALADASEAHETNMQARREAREVGSTLIAIDLPKLVDNIARNMKEVSAASAQQQSTAFAAGFKAMTDVIGLCIGMLNRVDQRMADLEANQPQPELPEEPEPEGEARNAQAMLLLQQALQQKQGNGAGPVNPDQAAALGQLLQQYLGQPSPQPTEPNGHAGQ